MLNQHKIWEGKGVIDSLADKPVEERKIILWNSEELSNAEFKKHMKIR